MDQTAGAPAPQFLSMDTAAKAELAAAAPPVAEGSAGYAVLTRDVEGLGRVGGVVCARAARISSLIAAGDARAATQADVELSAPFHIVDKD